MSVSTHLPILNLRNRVSPVPVASGSNIERLPHTIVANAESVSTNVNFYLQPPSLNSINCVLTVPSASSLNSEQELCMPMASAEPISTNYAYGGSSGSASRKEPRLSNLRTISECVTIEFCAGSAGLSAVLKQAGLQVIPIDHGGNTHKQKTRCVVIDLSSDDAWNLVETILRSGKVLYCHLGPPCGTASAARNRPVPQYLVAQGAPSPPPLRSQEHPLGLPGLKPKQLARVVTANKIYLLCSKVVRLCLQLNIIFSLENPLNSLFWSIPFIAELFSLKGVEFIVLDNCMFGSDRNKASGFMCTDGVFTSMAVRCNGKHVHAGWQLKWIDGQWKFDTALEAEYSLELCQALIACVLAEATKRGIAPQPDSIQGVLSERQRKLWLRATTGKLPRGKTLPQLISEFHFVEEWPNNERTIAKHQKLIRQFYRKGENGGQDELCRIVGTWREPEKFVEEALALQHPVDSTSHVPDILRKAIFDIMTLGPCGITKSRILALKQISALCPSLDRSKDQVIHPNNRKILSSLNIGLLENLIAETGYPDTHLCSDIRNGFDVVGEARSSGALSTKIVPASMTPDELRRNSRWTRKVTLARCKSSGDKRLDEEVYKQTEEQRSKAWIRGPFTIDELERLFPAGWIPICRFGLVQGPKTRVIDECRGPSINFALTTHDKLNLMDIDDFMALIKLIFRAVDVSSGEVAMPMEDGSILRDKVHPDWGKPNELNWLGRTLDLADAYKHLCNSESTKFAAVLATFNPHSGSFELDISDSLMFGSTAAVYGFNRVARAIWFLAVSKLHLVLTQFYDDFPGLEPSRTSRSAKVAFQAFLKLLGWEWSAGNKDLEFDELFSQLGVQVDLSDFAAGVVRIHNKPSRIESIEESIRSHLRNSSLSSSEASELHGKLQYCECQHFGRAAVPALRIIRSRADSRSIYTRINGELEWALKFMIEYLRVAKPRRITAPTVELPVCVFTDGSSEKDNHLFGIVIFRLEAKPLVAAGRVYTEIMKVWLSGQKQAINQIELFPVVLLREHFGCRLDGKKVLYFIDNDAARGSLIRGDSDAPLTTRIIRLFYEQEMRWPTFPWFCRVPSFSNPADLPSRGGLEEAASILGATVFEPKLLSPETMSKLIG